MTPKQENPASLKIVWEKPVLISKPTIFQVFESLLPTLTNVFDILSLINVQKQKL